MRILIISYYWPPAGGVSVQRIWHFVKELSALGVHCDVIAPHNAAYYQFDEELSTVLLANVEVHPVPIRDITSVIKKVPSLSKEGNTKSDNPSLLSKMARWVRANVFIPDPKLNWVPAVTKKAQELIDREAYEILFTNGTPHSVHIAGLGIKQRNDIKWIADFRDPWTKMDSFDRLPLTKRSIKKHKILEQKVIAAADLTLTVSPSWKADFEKAGAKRAKFITNGFDEYIDRIPSEEFIISHVGSLHADRNIDPIVESLAELLQEKDLPTEKIKLQLVGNVEGDLLENIKSHLPKGVLTNKGIQNHQEAKRAIGKSSLLLLPINESIASKGRIPAKIFEYMASGIPILLVGNIEGDAAQIIHQLSIGKCFKRNQTTAIKAYMLSQIQSPSFYRTDTEEIKAYSRAMKAKELLACMHELV